MAEINNDNVIQMYILLNNFFYSTLIFYTSLIQQNISIKLSKSERVCVYYK